MVIAIDDGRHFFIFPRTVNIKLSAGASFPFKGESPVVLTAHYDRVSGSPGANDNSAAVFQLLSAALRLGEQLKSAKNSRIEIPGLRQWIIIFTDKEELQKGDGIQKQGSYSLAKKLKSWGLSKALIFNFDACGTGDTFVFSGTADYLIKRNTKPGLYRASHIIKQLHEKAFEAVKKIHYNRAITLPVPFSDDAGFLRGGIPAQTITMLPASEAAPFAALLRTDPVFSGKIITGPVKPADRLLFPETWRCLNSPSDSHLRLTPLYYENVVRFMTELCKL